tara:strand:- start:961 stop:1164 length:204 start_codon:yes stop_codon:yes gene_type:complete
MMQQKEHLVEYTTSTLSPEIIIAYVAIISYLLQKVSIIQGVDGQLFTQNMKMQTSLESLTRVTAWSG